MNDLSTFIGHPNDMILQTYRCSLTFDAIHQSFDLGKTTFQLFKSFLEISENLR